MIRRCDFCKRSLYGKKGHGFPTRDGRAIACGSCKDSPRISVPPRAGQR